MEQTKSVFETLNVINVNGKTEKKNNLTYLSWAWAWAEVKNNFPDAQYKVYERDDGCIYWTDGRTCWVKTGVTICGLEHIEYLPIMDYRNAAIPADKVTSTDVNKAIQRSLTKACARHGLGLYIYAGEDLPEGAAPAQPETPEQPDTPEQSAQTADRYLDARRELTAAIAAYVESSGKPKADVLNALKEVPGGTMKTEQGCILLINQLKAWSK